ncbi:MAG: hypothetical protein ACFE0Q_13555 [Anaerolineae bacterium]
MIENDFFVDGENLLGRYTVVLLSQSEAGNWSPSTMQLDAMVTNYRLLLRPFRKKYRPASLPARYFKHTHLGLQDRYHCVTVQLITGHVLYMMLGTGKLDDLYNDLSTLKRPTPKFQFDDTIAKRDIERLITFFGKQPLHDSSPSPEA